MLTEINFDGIIGPSHNYAGLSPGNLAATSNAGKVSYPRAAALQGIAKMRANLALGLRQGAFLPLARRSEEHTSELQSLMRISYADLRLKKKNTLPILHGPNDYPRDNLDTHNHPSA